jgi:transcriptional regulator GlxA family with amidase domain
VMSARIQEARRLLEQTELAPKIVAQRCGLGSAAAMRRVFLRELGISAAEYRDKFRAQAASAVSPAPDRSGLPAR